MERTLWLTVRRALMLAKEDFGPNGQRAAQMVIDAIAVAYLNKPKRAQSRRVDDPPAPR